MADRRAVVAPIGFEQGTRGAQEEDVVLRAVVRMPAVPHPVVREPQHTYPLTPVAAMLLTNERWKARKKISTGMVMSVE